MTVAVPVIVKEKLLRVRFAESSCENVSVKVFFVSVISYVLRLCDGEDESVLSSEPLYEAENVGDRGVAVISLESDGDLDASHDSVTLRESSLDDESVGVPMLPDLLPDVDLDGGGGRVVDPDIEKERDASLLLVRLPMDCDHDGDTGCETEKLFEASLLRVLRVMVWLPVFVLWLADALIDHDCACDALPVGESD